MTADSPDLALVRQCPVCGYDVRGIVGDRCPECGETHDERGDVAMLYWGSRRHRAWHWVSVARGVTIIAGVAAALYLWVSWMEGVFQLFHIPLAVMIIGADVMLLLAPMPEYDSAMALGVLRGDDEYLRICPRLRKTPDQLVRWGDLRVASASRRWGRVQLRFAGRDTRKRPLKFTGYLQIDAAALAPLDAYLSRQIGRLPA